ncbi:hypothetical protein UVI_02060050 [Ustilaginoidea virens]|uniref:Uncharacterized protein n=1 Tax=Ustilaginoidea virens TaxID=1159556 RepID=A0A1B5L3I0_USTVR|nr:hypothetical protein UVI_02060050 [Ustilaginoidea virens]
MGHAEQREPPQLGGAAPHKSQRSSPAPDRRATTSGGSSDHGLCSRCCSRNDVDSHAASPPSPGGPASDRGDLADGAVHTPARFASPSVASSLAYSNAGFSISPLRRELSHTTPPKGVDAVTTRAARHDLARRLSRLARRLTYDGSEHVDDLVLGNQLERLERAVGSSPTAHGDAPDFGLCLGLGPRSLPYPPGVRSPVRSDAGSALASPASSLYKSQFSDLSASLLRERQAEKDLEEDEPPPKRGMTASQASKVIAEMAKLNDELSAVVTNLKARQEESQVRHHPPINTKTVHPAIKHPSNRATQHIQGLLIERAERAAQRIIFLQNRISYLRREYE